MPQDQIPAIITHILNKISGIEHGDKCILIAEKLLNTALVDGVAVVGHRAFIAVAGTDKAVCLAVLVDKVQLDLQTVGFLVHQPFDLLLTVIADSIKGIADSVGHSRFARAVVSGYVTEITEIKMLRFGMVAEIGQCKTGDFHSGDLFHTDTLLNATKECCFGSVRRFGSALW